MPAFGLATSCDRQAPRAASLACGLRALFIITAASLLAWARDIDLGALTARDTLASMAASKRSVLVECGIPHSPSLARRLPCYNEVCCGAYDCR